MMRNIYLFPTGYRADDLKVLVLDPDNVNIPNAVVGLYQEPSNNYIPATLNTNDVYDTLYPCNGLISDMSTTTDTNGVATFSGSKLVLGGRYKVMVAPIKFNNQVLYFGLTHVTELSANLPVIIKLQTQAPALLWATSASNQVIGSIASSGTAYCGSTPRAARSGLHRKASAPRLVPSLHRSSRRRPQEFRRASASPSKLPFPRKLRWWSSRIHVSSCRFLRRHRVVIVRRDGMGSA